MSEANNSVAWAEIPVRDLQAAKAFYSALFLQDLEEQVMGPSTTILLPNTQQSTAGHLYEGKPAANGSGPTIHLGVPGPVESAMDRVKSAGGTVLSEAISIPAGNFAYCLDPDGNSIGVFVR